MMITPPQLIKSNAKTGNKLYQLNTQYIKKWSITYQYFDLHNTEPKYIVMTFWITL